MNNLNPTDVLKFLRFVNDLKRLPRRGWLPQIENPESISGHMYAMALMTFLIDDKSNLDRLKCLQLTLVHDLAEAIVGDITPLDNIPVNVKHEKEDEAMKEITANIGSAGLLIYNLYKEYEAKETPEAKFVKDLDRFDFLSTAAYYEELENRPEYFQEFFDTYGGKFEHPFIKKLTETLQESRLKISCTNNGSKEGTDGNDKN